MTIQSPPTPPHALGSDAPTPSGFRLTGRMVLLILVSFFGVVITVNLYMAYVAVNTFSGLQTQRPYETGLKFNHTMKNAQRQIEQHWSVSSHYERQADGQVKLNLSMRDGQGRPIENVVAKVSLVSPVNALNDADFDLVAQAPGEMVGTTRAEAGQWDLVIAISQGTQQGAQEVFRSVSRISLR